MADPLTQQANPITLAATAPPARTTGNTPVNDWSTNNTISNAADTNSIYQQYLGRDATSADDTAIGTGQLTNAQLVSSITGSDEYKTKNGIAITPATNTALNTDPSKPNITGPTALDSSTLSNYATNPTPNTAMDPAALAAANNQALYPTLPDAAKATALKVDPNAAGTNLDPNNPNYQVNSPTAVSAAQSTAGQVDPSVTANPGTQTYTAAQIASYTPQALAAQGQVDPRSLMQNEYASLMNFPPEAVPDWAKGAVAVAKGALAASGLNNSSMAAGAITSALMQAGLPIAQNDAKVFEDMNLANLSNQQQANIVNTQARVQTMMADSAAVNAAQQFNASSTNQVNEFYHSLATQVGQFNATQLSAISEFNAGETNSTAKFNSQLKAQQDQFNASNRLAIDQSNVTWQRNINTANTAAANAANNQNAASALSLSETAMNNIWQSMRDQANFTFTSGQNAQNRAAAIALSDLNSQHSMDYLKATYNYQSELALGQSIGNFASSVLSNNAGALVNGVKDLFNGSSTDYSSNNQTIGGNVTPTDTGTYDNTTTDPYA